jgi:invasion protein IalB
VEDKQKRRKALVTKLDRSEPGMGLISDGPGKWKLTLVAPEGLQIEPGDVISIDNLLLDQLKSRSADGSVIPVKFEADKSSMTKKAAKAKVSRQQKEEQ